MSTQKAAMLVNTFTKSYPELMDEALDLFDLYITEIEDGGSPEGEYESLVQSLEQLVENDNN